MIRSRDEELPSRPPPRRKLNENNDSYCRQTLTKIQEKKWDFDTISNGIVVSNGSLKTVSQINGELVNGLDLSLLHPSIEIFRGHKLGLFTLRAIIITDSHFFKICYVNIMKKNVNKNYT